MPTADPSNVLFRIAHPDLYERNPFNLLNLPINATARDIRRRKEDIKAAFDAGTEAEEFRFVLPVDANRRPPTRETVNEAFDALDDPETRIAYALFWFWTDKRNPQLKGSEIDEPTIEDWEKSSSSFDCVLRHNLAVYKHLSALSMENPASRLATIMSQTQDLVDAQGELSDCQIKKLVKDVAAEYVALDSRFCNEDTLLCEVRKYVDIAGVELDEAQVREYYSRRSTIDDRINDDSCDAPDALLQWNDAIELWNSVVSDVDFWHSVSEMVSALNDPRLDYRFARSLRDQFAFAFDQINVELAIEFAKTGRESDAKRQVKYMKLSQPDADDVEGTFDDAFAGLLRQTEAICKAAQDETEKNHKDGLRQANLILEQTDEPLRVSRVVLEKGTAIRNAIGTTIFSAVRNCLIAYGNETEEWDECLSLAYQMSAFAETVEQWNLLSEDVNTLEDLSRKDNLRHSCWICKTRIPKHMHDSSVISVPLHGRFEASKDYRSVNYKAIDIDVPVCANCLSERSPHSFEKFPECIAYPTVIDAVKDGWNIGKEVSPETVEEVLSSARSKNQEDKKAGNSYGLTSDQQLFAQIRLRTND